MLRRELACPKSAWSTNVRRILQIGHTQTVICIIHSRWYYYLIYILTCCAITLLMEATPLHSRQSEHCVFSYSDNTGVLLLLFFGLISPWCRKNKTLIETLISVDAIVCAATALIGAPPLQSRQSEHYVFSYSDDTGVLLLLFFGLISPWWV